MKLKLAITGLMLLISTSLSAEQDNLPAQDAPPEGNFYEYRDWAGAIMSTHDFWGENACVAYTLADDGVSRLEVMSLFDGEGYTEPTIQIVSPYTEVYFEVLVETVGKSSVFSLLPLFSSVADSDMTAAVVNVDEREALLKALVAKSRVIAKYVDSQGVVKEVKFSLMGSSATIKQTFNHCGTGLNNTAIELN